MTDAFAGDGPRDLILAVNLGPEAQLGVVSEVLADISAVLAAGAALDDYRRSREFFPRTSARRTALSQYIPFGRGTELPPLTFDIPQDTFVLQRVIFENPVSVAGTLTALAGLGIPSILRMIRDWKTDRRIQTARADDAESRQRQSSRLRDALVDRLVDDVRTADVRQIDEVVNLSIGAIERLMDQELGVAGLDSPAK